MIAARIYSGNGLFSGLEATHAALEDAQGATAAAKVTPPRITPLLNATKRCGTHMAYFILVLAIHALLIARASSRRLSDF